MKNTPLYLLLILFLTLIFFRSQHQPTEKVIPDKQPNKVVVIEPDVVPVLESNIVYDLSEAQKLSKQYKKNIILVFGAEWCDYCKELKKVINSKSIEAFNNYIICIINIEEKNQDLVKQYEIKRLPTSILLNDNLKEWSRKIGYQQKEYELWLKNL